MLYRVVGLFTFTALRASTEEKSQLSHAQPLTQLSESFRDRVPFNIVKNAFLTALREFKYGRTLYPRAAHLPVSVADRAAKRLKRVVMPLARWQT